jgi:hypothetical protein
MLWIVFLCISLLHIHIFYIQFVFQNFVVGSMLVWVLSIIMYRKKNYNTMYDIAKYIQKAWCTAQVHTKFCIVCWTFSASDEEVTAWLKKLKWRISERKNFNIFVVRMKFVAGLFLRWHWLTSVITGFCYESYFSSDSRRLNLHRDPCRSTIFHDSPPLSPPL